MVLELAGSERDLEAPKEIGRAWLARRNRGPIDDLNLPRGNAWLARCKTMPVMLPIY